MQDAQDVVATVPLGHGADLHLAMPAHNGSVEVGLAHEGRHLVGALFHRLAPHRALKISTHLVKADLAIHVDHFKGEVTASGDLNIAGHDLLKFDNDVLASYSPCNGMVGTNPVPDPPVVRSAEYGDSQPYASHVTRIFVDPDERLFTDVGAIVKEKMFPDYPPFVFNTVSCIGTHDPAAGKESYTDPHSPWFNVFVGYYQIDAPKKSWDRPFGYAQASGEDSNVAPTDLLALGKSDWNWFANWMYGVPEEVAESESDLEQPGVETTQSGPELRGKSLWHTVDVTGLRFISAYESDAPDAAKLVRNSLLTGAWRHCYGPPSPRPDWPHSFVPTTMATRLYMSYHEDEDAFHTVMFGGSAPDGADPGFLDAQLAAGQAVIERTYPALGFPPD